MILEGERHDGTEEMVGGRREMYDVAVGTDGEIE
jgi:hypothetical protein